MDKNKCVILEIVLLVFILIIIRTDITAALSINEHLNFASEGNVATANNITSNNNYSSGDPYIDEVYKGCVTARDVSMCTKFKALKYFHEMIPPFQETGSNAEARRPEFALWGPVKLTPLPPDEVLRNDQILFPGSISGSTDSESMKLFRFTLREVERFLKSYGLVIDFPTVESSERLVESPRIIDDFFSGSLKGGKINEKRKLLLFSKHYVNSQILDPHDSDYKD
jgi:hypothetical protein